MTEEDRKLMEQYGITWEQKTVYYYMGHKYEHLENALKYARIHTETRAAQGK